MASYVPDRVSAEKSSPFYLESAGRIECKLDGVVQKNALEACVSEGWVKRCKVDGNGRIVVSLGEVQTEIVSGKVELAWLQARKK